MGWEIAYEIMRLFFIVGSIGAFVVGLILIFRPDSLAQFNDISNSWYSERKSTKPLDIMRDSDRVFMRNHQITGWIMLVASLVGLYLLVTRIPHDPFDQVKGMDEQVQLVANVVVDVAKWFFIVFTAAGLPIWILMIFKPATLERVSNFFNRWISTRNMMRPLEEMDHRVDSFVLKYHVIFGAFFALGGVVILIFFLRH
jgi:hypothetical protein